MVADMTYSTVSAVVDSWEKVRLIPNFQEKLGIDLFRRCVHHTKAKQYTLFVSLSTKSYYLTRNTTFVSSHRLFEAEPKAAAVFSFGHVTKLNEEFFQNKVVVRHASHYMNMLDRAVGLLGPDIELLTEILVELGQTHAKFGVDASFYPPMGQALIATLKDHLGNNLTDEAKEAWLEVYGAMSYDMIRAKSMKI
jgi:hemoglobin-like flavoprotein